MRYTSANLGLVLRAILFLTAKIPHSSQQCPRLISTCLPRWSCLRKDLMGCPHCATERRLGKIGCPSPVFCLRMVGYMEKVSSCVVCTEACTVRSNRRRTSNLVYTTLPIDHKNSSEKQEGLLLFASSFSFSNDIVTHERYLRPKTTRQPYAGSGHTTVTSEVDNGQSAEDCINDV